MDNVKQFLEVIDGSLVLQVLTPLTYALIVLVTRIGVEFARRHDVPNFVKAVLEGLSNQDVTAAPSERRQIET